MLLPKGIFIIQYTIFIPVYCLETEQEWKVLLSQKNPKQVSLLEVKIPVFRWEILIKTKINQPEGCFIFDHDFSGDIGN